MNTWENEARQALMQRSLRLRAQDPVGTLSERDSKELRDIDDALARMREGGFGQCSRCGGAIGRHRLRAVPEARYCLTCSTLVVR